MDDSKKTELIELLNGALQIEYTDVFLYPRESELIKEKDIREKFERFGRMELRHADNIAIAISNIGGEPHWEFTILDTEGSVDEMLLGHLNRERRCIDMYDKLIGLIDNLEEDQLKLVLKGIRSEEETHLKAIKEIIEKRRTKRNT